MSPENWITLIQEVGLAATLALVISLQLRRVIDNGRQERVEQQARFLDYLKDNDAANREVISELSQTLFELRGAILGADLENEPTVPAKVRLQRADALIKTKRLRDTAVEDEE